MSETELVPVSCSETVRIEWEKDCAVVVIDNPPVNIASHSVRAGLLAAFRRVAVERSARAAVVIGAGRCFVSGSDVREFAGPIAEPQMPAVLDAIVACPKPVVAALHTMAFGGGFEIALACDARVAAIDLEVALPELRFGIIPGAGGTQRLPRLAGLPAALDIISTGRRVAASEALALGLVDAVVDGGLRQAAIDHALGLSGKSDLSTSHPPEADTAELEVALTRARRHERGRPYVTGAVEAILWSRTEPMQEGLRRERALFQRLRGADEAAALRHLFFAEREASRPAELAGIKGPEFHHVAVVGAGTMGRGIAAALVVAGYRVTLVDRDEASLSLAGQEIETLLGRSDSGRPGLQQGERPAAHLHKTTCLADCAQADLAIEAVYEDITVKSAVIAALDRSLRPEALIATNTSYLDVDTLAAAAGRPERVFGLHFFSPAHVMKLLEVVPGRATAPEALAAGFALARRLGKVAVRAGNNEGFIGNRIYNAYRNECERMVEEGALPQEVDTTLEGFGFAMGPFRVGDLSGLDIAWANRKRRAAACAPASDHPSTLDRLCEAGRLGRKSGAGWYRYVEGQRSGQPDPEVAAIIAAEAARKGILQRPITPEEVLRRALAAIVTEAHGVMSTGIARSAADIDLVLCHGYGFPDFRGGPMFHASQGNFKSVDF